MAASGLKRVAVELVEDEVQEMVQKVQIIDAVTSNPTKENVEAAAKCCFCELFDQFCVDQIFCGQTIAGALFIIKDIWAIHCASRYDCNAAMINESGIASSINPETWLYIAGIGGITISVVVVCVSNTFVCGCCCERDSITDYCSIRQCMSMQMQSKLHSVISMYCFHGAYG